MFDAVSDSCRSLSQCKSRRGQYWGERGGRERERVCVREGQGEERRTRTRERARWRERGRKEKERARESSSIDMYNNDVGKGVVYAYEAYEAK